MPVISQARRVLRSRPDGYTTISRAPSAMQGLRMWLPLNDDGLACADRSGHRNHLTANKSGLWSVDPKFGRVLSIPLAGSPNYARAASCYPISTFPDGLTVMVWACIHATQTITSPVILSKAPVNESYLLFFRDSTARFRIYDGSSMRTAISGPGAVNRTTWQHWAGTWDGAIIRLYIDAVYLAQDTCTNLNVTTGHLYLGDSDGQGTNQAGVDIAEVTILDRGLSADEVAYFFDLGRYGAYSRGRRVTGMMAGAPPPTFNPAWARSGRRVAA